MSSSVSSSVWTAILENIRSRVSKQQFATWFENLQVFAHTEQEINIRVPHQFFKEWLTHHYIDVIQDAILEVTNSQPAITFKIDDTVRPQQSFDDHTVSIISTEPNAPAAPFNQSQIRGMRINDQYTFDNFVIGPSNQLANAASQAVSASLGTTYNPLFMHGSVGLGKSHLLQAICNASLQNTPGIRVAYLSCETFVNEFIAAIQKNDLPSFRNRYRQLDLLVIDDIQFLSRAERSQEEFFHTFNDLYNSQKQIVLTSDQSPSEIAGLQDRLSSRFQSGLVARIDKPSYEMRVAILKRKAELRGVLIPDNVLNFIANTITSNIRELDGAITKVVGYASLLNQPIDMESARTALNEPGKQKTAIHIDDIIKVVTEHCSVKLSDLQSKKRTRSIVYPRQLCMYLARALTMLSLEEIGGYFGGRDHSTVLHAEDKIRNAISKDKSVLDTVNKLFFDLNVEPPADLLS